MFPGSIFLSVVYQWAMKIPPIPIPSVGEQLFLLWVSLQSLLNQVAQPTIYIYIEVVYSQLGKCFVTLI